MTPSTVETALHLKLADAGHTAPSADNSQPWHLCWDGTTLAISYDRQRVQGLTFPAWAPATLLAIGGVLEHISQAAEALETTISLDMLPHECESPDCYAKIQIPETSPTNHDLKKHPLYKRHTNRFRFSTAPVPPDVLLALEDMSQGTAHVTTLLGKQEKATVAQLVRSAGEVRFQTREIHEWLGASLRFSEADVRKADGLDVRTIDLPPGGRQFLKFISDWKRIRLLNKLGTYKILANIDAAPVEKSPAIMAFTGEDTTTGAIDAGRLLSRVWIHLNSQGLAVHPYYVVSDQIFRLGENAVPQHLVNQIQDVNQRTRGFFGLAENQALYMLLRVGYPTREAPHSQRLPLEKVFTDLTQPSHS
jgi:hypothetical protein